MFVLIKDKLNTYFKTLGIENPKVDFVDPTTTESDDTISFKSNTVTPVLINIEEDRIMRPANLYARNIAEQGVVQSENSPEIRINLLVLFVSKFADYPEGLKFLSYIIKFFQANRVFDHHNSPTLSREIEKLIMELSPPVLQEQDAVWNALRTSYLPSILYKIKMLVYFDEDSLQAANMVTSVPYDVSNGALKKGGFQNQKSQAGLSSTEFFTRQTNPPPLPGISPSVKDTVLKADYDTEAIVELEHTEKGITYQLFCIKQKGDLPLPCTEGGLPVTVNEDGMSLQLFTQPLTADHTFCVKATNLSGGGETYLKDDVKVKVYPRTDVEVTVSDKSIHTGESATIILKNPQSGISYQLKRGGDNSGEAKVCRDESTPLHLTSAVLAEPGKVTFTVQATSAVNTLSVTLTQPAVVEVEKKSVHIDPDLEVVLKSLFVTHDGQADITVKGTQKGVKYQLTDKANETPHGDTVEGPGEVSLFSKHLQKDTTFIIRATPVEGGNSVDLTTKPDVLVGWLFFEGADSTNKGKGLYVDFNNNEKLKVSGNQTIEMWIDPDNLTGDKKIYYKGWAYSGSILINNETIKYVFSGTVGENSSQIAQDLSQFSGQFIHLAIVRNMDTKIMTWYVNGKEDSLGNITANDIDTQDQHAIIGGSEQAYGSYEGRMAEVRIWNRVRTQENILNNKNKRLNGNEEGLIAYWKMNEGKGDVIHDTSENNINGDIKEGDPKWG